MGWVVRLTLSQRSLGLGQVPNPPGIVEVCRALGVEHAILTFVLNGPPLVCLAEFKQAMIAVANLASQHTAWDTFDCPF